MKYTANFSGNSKFNFLESKLYQNRFNLLYFRSNAKFQAQRLKLIFQIAYQEKKATKLNLRV